MNVKSINYFEPLTLVAGTVALRRHLPLKEGVEAMEGKYGIFQVLWQIESDDLRYPNEWALRPYCGEAYALWQQLGIPWIASGDLVLSQSVVLGSIPTGAGGTISKAGEVTGDVTIQVNFGVEPLTR